MRTYELLPEQKKIWDIQRMYPAVGICNIGGYLHLEGKYNEDILKRTMETFVRTNSSFWTKFNKEGKIYIDEIKEYKAEVCDYTELTTKEADVKIEEMICEPFDIYNSYLFDFKILKLSDKTVVFEKFHHIIADGYSVALCAKIQEKIYEQIKSGMADFETDTRYIDRLERYNNSEDIEDSEAKNSLYKENKKNEDEFENTRFVKMNMAIRNADAGIVAENRFDYIKINEFCRKNRISVEALFYGSIGIYFCKMNNCDAINIGRNLLNRGREDMTMVALKVDTKNYVVKPEWNKSCVDYFAELKKNLAKHVKVAHDECYKEKADIVVSYRPVRYLPAPDKGECREYMNSYVEVPVKFFINDNGKSIELQVKYQKELYDRQDIENIIKKIKYIIEQVIDNPDSPIDLIKIIDENEYNIIRKYGTGHKWEYGVSVPERFVSIVKENIDNKKTALIYRDKNYTYREVYEMVLKAKHLIRKSAKDVCDINTDADRIAGICMRRTPWLPVVMFAAWLSGYGIMPVSPNDSAERKKKIESQCSVFITDNMIEEIDADENILIDYKHDIRTDIPAYYMYTSGTTGEAKAVMIAHSSLSCRIEWMAEQFSAGIDVIMQKTRNTFDVSVWELVLPWVYGKTMCMLADMSESDPVEIDKCIKKNKVTMIHFVPSMFRHYVKYITDRNIVYKNLKYIILSGEALDANLVKTAKEHLRGVEIYNLYGPTECTIDVSYYRCTGWEKNVPIGSAVYGTGLYVINERGDLLPPGVKGELAVTGELVGIGYYGVAEDVKSRYCHMKEDESIRMYRTGDMAYLGHDGYIYYEGRCDNQVKIRGMRANPDEIENILNNSMREVWNIVIYINGHLVDFYSGDITLQAIRQCAKDILPYYLVPAEYVKVDKIPIGKHGKTDRNQLIQMYNRMKNNNKNIQSDKNVVTGEMNGREKSMLEIACNCLNNTNIDIDTNLLDAGMDSLSILEFISQCENKGIRILYNEVYEKQCIRELVKNSYSMEKGLVFLKGEKEKNNKRIMVFIPFAGGTPYSFRAVAEKLSGEDVALAAVNMPYFIDDSIERIADNIKEALEYYGGYEEIYLSGSCVGSALAVRLALVLGDMVKGIMLCEALPYKTKAGKGKESQIIWDMMNDEMIGKTLSILRGKRFALSDSMKKCFMADVRKSAVYMSKEECIIPDCDVIMLYGEKDMLTLGFRRKYRRWRRWIKSSYKIYTYKNGRHFMTEDNPDIIAGIIKENFL